jgi:hypothetical protein
MKCASDQLAGKSLLREHQFESHTSAVGPIGAHLRSGWYNMAARGGDQSVINQQAAYNQAAAQLIAAQDQQVAELDQRLILADRDLTA